MATKKKKEKIKEGDLYLPIKTHFSSLGYKVNSEVENKYGSKRADIILTNEETKEVIGIELKTLLSFELIDQAYYWKNYTDYTYIAVPKIKSARPDIIETILREFNIGFIEIDMDKFNKYYVNNNKISEYNHEKVIDRYNLGLNFKLKPKHNNPNKKSKSDLISVIQPEHEYWLDGGSSTKKGTYVTTYALLMMDVYKYLECNKDKWVHTKDIWEHLQNNSDMRVLNHYKVPLNGIKQALEKYESAYVRSTKIKNKKMFKLDKINPKFKALIKEERKYEKSKTK